MTRIPHPQFGRARDKVDCEFKCKARGHPCILPFADAYTLGYFSAEQARRVASEVAKQPNNKGVTPDYVLEAKKLLASIPDEDAAPVASTSTAMLADDDGEEGQSEPEYELAEFDLVEDANGNWFNFAPDIVLPWEEWEDPETGISCWRRQVN